MTLETQNDAPRGKHAKHAKNADAFDMKTEMMEPVAKTAGAHRAKPAVEPEAEPVVDLQPLEPLEDVDADATVALDPATMQKTVAMEAVAQDEADDFAGFDVEPAEFQQPAREQMLVPAPVTAEEIAAHNPQFNMGKPEKNRKGLKVFGIALGIVVAAIAAVYVAGGIFFSSHFFPNTYMGSRDISLSTTEEVADQLSKVAEGYSIGVSGFGFKLDLASGKTGLKVDGAQVAKEMHDQQNAWEWPLQMMGSRDLAGMIVSSGFDGEKCSADVTEAVKKFNKTAEAPVNATFEYSKKSKKFEIVPEKLGTKLDAEAVLKELGAAVAAMEPTCELTEEALLRPEILSDNEKLKKAAEDANKLSKVDVKCTLEGVEAGTIDSDDVMKWVKVNDKMEVSLDQDEMAKWVKKTVRGFNTVGSTRIFKNAKGKKITVSGGSYGWAVDTKGLEKKLTEAILSGSSETIEIPCTQKGAVYKGEGKRDWGNRYIDVDLSKQRAVFYDENSKVIWKSDIVTGKPTPDLETPEGVWMINLKASPMILHTYEPGATKPSKTRVEYWMPFKDNTHGFHDAWWQAAFGGTRYQDGYGSHGCVNLPSDKAGQLYELIEVGDPVVIHW